MSFIDTRKKSMKTEEQKEDKISNPLDVNLRSISKTLSASTTPKGASKVLISTTIQYSSNLIGIYGY